MDSKHAALCLHEEIRERLVEHFEDDARELAAQSLADRFEDDLAWLMAYTCHLHNTDKKERAGLESRALHFLEREIRPTFYLPAEDERRPRRHTSQTGANLLHAAAYTLPPDACKHCKELADCGDSPADLPCGSIDETLKDKAKADALAKIFSFSTDGVSLREPSGWQDWRAFQILGLLAYDGYERNYTENLEAETESLREDFLDNLNDEIEEEIDRLRAKFPPEPEQEQEEEKIK